ncbi:exopolysaccharide biosynthesis protein [Palleronia aestuarii]|uniref:exopolysaccharide biosynthesis protein n=1 Tax=Palleronia aestuarii TaxID=568105 RepID=UPI001473C432|nr:exopolysaccharide biosynthesis protein [Palleronia aestuarii]
MDTILAAPAGPPRHLSTLLRTLAPGGPGRVSLGEIIAAMGRRGFAPLLLLLAAPNLVLYVPGASTITGIPLLLVAAQLLAGRDMAWLPGMLARRSMERDALRRVIEAALPWIERVERLARPRLWPRGAGRAAGIACLVMAIVLILPLPFVNVLPAAAILLMALGMGERDGLWLAAGLLVGLVCLALAAAILGGAALALAQTLA